VLVKQSNARCTQTFLLSAMQSTIYVVRMGVVHNDAGTDRVWSLEANSIGVTTTTVYIKIAYPTFRVADDGRIMSVLRISDYRRGEFRQGPYSLDFGRSLARHGRYSLWRRVMEWSVISFCCSDTRTCRAASEHIEHPTTDSLARRNFVTTVASVRATRKRQPLKTTPARLVPTSELSYV
jgi:hypothetical protein